MAYRALLKTETFQWPKKDCDILDQGIFKTERLILLKGKKYDVICIFSRLQPVELQSSTWSRSLRLDQEWLRPIRLNTLGK